MSDTMIDVPGDSLEERFAKINALCATGARCGIPDILERLIMNDVPETSGTPWHFEGVELNRQPISLSLKDYEKPFNGSGQLVLEGEFLEPTAVINNDNPFTVVVNRDGTYAVSYA